MKHTTSSKIRTSGFVYSAPLMLLCMWLLSCGGSKKGGQTALQKAEAKLPFDAIIVPGIPFVNNRWDTVMKGRVLWAWVLYKNGFAKNVIFSGDAVYSPYRECKIMGLYAEALGIPAAHIFYDTLATHSTENVYYSYLLAKKNGFKNIALATDPVQSFMLRNYTKARFVSEVYHLPFDTDTLRAYNHLNPEIDATAELVNDFTPLPKRKSWWKRMRGTFGKNIKWEQYPEGRVPAL